jgi:hypothetical protein
VTRNVSEACVAAVLAWLALTVQGRLRPGAAEQREY